MYDIQYSDEDISNMSKTQFKKVVYEQVDKFAFNYLLRRSENHSKLKFIVNSRGYNRLRRQQYLQSDMFSKQEAQLCFKLRM